MERKKKLLLDMYRASVIDGSLTREELIVLNNYCYKHNIEADELTKISKNTDNEQFTITDEKEKEKYLFEIVRIIISDGIIKEEEIYLFDKIAKSLKTKKNSSVLRKEIFKIVIDEFITQKKRQLSLLESQLNDEYEKNILSRKVDKTISVDDHERIIKDLIEGYEKGEYGYPDIEHFINIFIIGVSELSHENILQIVENEFKKSESITQNLKIKICVGDKQYIKNHFPNYKQAILRGDFNLFIYGAHPHSLKGKPENISWEIYLKDTLTTVFGNYHDSISKSQLVKDIKSFIEQNKQ